MQAGRMVGRQEIQAGRKVGWKAGMKDRPAGMQASRMEGRQEI